ncbi:WGxxGxxG family protein [Actinophytocola glycyrrhizae]|uniref:WGxxGxxG family protein n=1 Tax=Actinophytocola glycyrrhizae TaxID=2044873 RepID=A0ABV9S869_9PSEU
MKALLRAVLLALTASSAILVGPVTPVAAAPQTTHVAAEENRGEEESGDDDNGMWGLLGLLGLVGLVGLVRRGRRNEYLAGPADAPPATRYGDK